MKIALLGNTDLSIYNYRFELIQKLIDEGHEVFVVCPNGKYIEKMIDVGCKYENIEMERHGTNPIKDMLLVMKYKKILKRIKPDIVFSYTIKPNIYGSYACKKLRIPCVVNVTGLGTAVEKESLMQKIIIKMYKVSLKKVKTIFFQNEENMEFFKDKNIYVEKHVLIPGSGVNLDKFAFCEYPKEDTIRFCFVSRIMKEKGIEEYLEAAKTIKEKYPNTCFDVYGFCENEYEGKLREYHNLGIVNYCGMTDNVADVYKKSHCTVMPTYYPEGLCNVLLESCATGRPIITTNRSGCREVIDDKVNGYIVEEKNCEDLVSKIETFINLSYNDKIKMGINGRKKMESQFDRNIIIDAYLKEIDCLKE